MDEKCCKYRSTNHRCNTFRFETTGCQKFSNDIESMLGFQPGLFWKVCWVGICPICLLVIFFVVVFFALWSPNLRISL